MKRILDLIPATALAVAVCLIGEPARADPYWELDATFTPETKDAALSMDSTLTLLGRQTDGSYLLYGDIDTVNGVHISDDLLNTIRLTTTGTRDTTLPLNPAITPLSVEPDGHFIARGNFGESSTIARFAADGTMTATFPIPDTGRVVADSTGRVYVTSDSTTTITRYNPDGMLDSSFAADAPGGLFELLPTADGKVFVKTGGGSFVNTFEVYRLTTTGAVDSTFEKITLQYATSQTIFAVLPDDGLLLVQEVFLSQYADAVHCVRYDNTGQAVFTFDGASDKLILAGVMLDSLIATGGGELLINASTLIGQPDRLPTWIHVRSDGQASIVTGTVLNGAGPMVRYLRTSLDVPSIPLAPSIGRTPDSATVSEDGYASFSVQALGVEPFTYQWKKGGVPIDGATSASLVINPAALDDAGNYTVTITNGEGSITSEPVTLTVNAAEPTAPVIAGPPGDSTVSAGGAVSLFTAATGHPLPETQWQHNGVDIPGAVELSLGIVDFDPADTGLYALVATNASGTAVSDPAILGLTTTDRAFGEGDVVATGVPHPNGNICDQVLMTGAAVSITAGEGKVTRTSFIDLNDNIVQVEFSGAGTLSIVLADASAPATPVNYTQDVAYMKGHAGIVIAGADQTTNVTIFSVGRATAYDPTGAYNILQPPSETNVPANNGSPLFAGHANTDYNGVAQIAFIAISGQTDFGGVRAANVHFYAHNGWTGIYAPRTSFTGPVYIGEITAFDDANPVIRLGTSPSDARIAGGNLAQDNGKAVEVSGLIELHFTPGLDSAGRSLPAQNNQAVLEEDGQDVTSSIVVNPAP